MISQEYDTVRKFPFVFTNKDLRKNRFRLTQYMRVLNRKITKN